MLRKKKDSSEDKMFCMKKNIWVAITVFILFLLVFTSGCLDFNGKNDGTTYSSHPTKIQYVISYGYRINITGQGNFEIEYNCDLPEVLIGTVSSINPLTSGYTQVTLANNDMIRWAIEDNGEHSYELGVMAIVEAQSYLYPNINSENAESLTDIKTNYPNIFNQYTRIQSVNNTVYIDANNSGIKAIAENILDEKGGGSSFTLAKELFLWLKSNIDYQVHNDARGVQTADETFKTKKGDCDDISVLYLSLCRSVELPARLIRGFLVEENNDAATSVAHAWVEVFLGGNIGFDGWLPVECACSSDDQCIQIDQNFGVESANHLRLFEDQGTNESLNISIAGISLKYDELMNVNTGAFVEVTEYTVLETNELYVSKKGNREYR